MTGQLPYRRIGTAMRGGIVCVADHASAFVPEDIPLGIAPDLLDKHIAIDIGVEGVVERLARRQGIAAHAATVSRLVCDLHRAPSDPKMLPVESDGHTIPGNIGADIAMRIARFHEPYHTALGEWLDEAEPELILAVHSFTPRMESGGRDRPWEVGLLYNQDDTAARHAIRMFEEEGFTVGDNEPYPGTKLNYTMDRHAEAHGRRYLTIEVRQDQIATEAGQARWAALIADIAQRTALMMRSA